MSLFSPFPPHRLHSSRQIAPQEALSLLSSYLEATTVESYLQPNALLTEGGPVSATSGPNTGLVIHNLRRVEAGLRGQHLTADLLADEYDYKGQPDQQSFRNAMNQSALTALPNGNVASADVDIGLDGWQDKTEFEREQDITQGEVGDRLQGVTDLQGEDVKVPQVHVTRTHGEKEDRKRRKREKRRVEKVETEAKKKEIGLNRKQAGEARKLP
ncbi:hypothetical protein MMC11_008227 [Xylographa trunciseda]|nr:hypothetical protein [Xylographa trunciseda]